MKAPIAEVEWLDASVESRSLSPQDALAVKPIKRKNIGYLLLRNKERVIICIGFLYDEEEMFCDKVQVIPRGCVKTIRFL